MKILNVFLAFYFTVAYSNDIIQNLRQEGYRLVRNKSYEEDENIILYNFYSEKIERMDLETLKKNPEIIFRRGCAWFEFLFDIKSFKKFINQLDEVKKDFKFVLDNADKESRVFLAADLKYKLIDYILKSSPKNDEEFIDSVFKFNENLLKKWAKDITLTGKALREDVFLNLEENVEKKMSFHDFISLYERDPDVSLKYIQPYDIDIDVCGIVPYGKNKGALLYRIEFFRLGLVYTYENEI